MGECLSPGQGTRATGWPGVGGSIGTALLFPVLDLLQVFSKLWSRAVVPRGFHQCQLCQLFYVWGYFSLLYGSTPRQ